MTTFWRNSIIGFFWAMLIFLIITTNTSQMFLSMLFTVVVLHFSEGVSEKYLDKPKFKKVSSLILSASILTIITIALYYSFKFMGEDLKRLIQESLPVIAKTMKDLGLEQNISTISELYNIITDFVKTNIGFITFGASLLLKVIIGIILGIVVHFSQIKEQDLSNVWGYSIDTINEQCKTIYTSFRDIMSIQIIISLMNTAIISIMAIGLTYVIYGEFLPYWYVIIPLTAILSLIPVVGNIMINVILILATIQISPQYVLIGIGLFLLIHKLELIVIGNKMNEKVGIPFIIILFSMILGELLFHSMSGMMLGMIIMVSISKILRNIKNIK